MRRVRADTNVIISALLFPGSTPALALRRILSGERLVLTPWIFDELHEVVGRRRPDLLGPLREFLATLSFDLAEQGEASGDIADPDDKLILDAALAGDIDIIVSGDKHFLSLDLERPRVVTPRAYLDESGRA